MQRFMLKSKIHRATLTGTYLDYEGSITVDEGLLEKADILPGEQVHVLNINSGARFVTYTIAGPRGSGNILLNGAAARLGQVGDKVIIISYCQVPAENAKDFKTTIVLVDESNEPKEQIKTMEQKFKVTEIEVGFHPDGFRIDKAASAMNRYTRWDISGKGQWEKPVSVCFDSLPEQGWFKTDKFDWDEINTDKE